MSDNIVIIAAASTAVGRVGGNLNSLPATAPGATVVRAQMEGTGVAPDQIDQVILDQVSAAGTGKIPAYQTTLNAGPLHQVPAMTIDEVCCSSLKALHQAMHASTCGGSQIVIAGGRKSMNQIAHGLPRSRTGQRWGHRPLVETVIVDGLWDAFNQIHLGVTAEHIAQEYGYRRRVEDVVVATSRQQAGAIIRW
jgi:acetyl-CoA C-acetyltransferase